MNAADFESFLKDAGNAYTVAGDGDERRFYFKDRGYTFCGISSESDPTFFHVVANFSLAGVSLDPAPLQRVLLDIENEYKVVKMRAYTEPPPGQDAFFQVAVEQFVPKTNDVSGIFWRSLDLMRAAGSDCLVRLKTPPAEIPADSEDWNAVVAGIESAMQSCAADPGGDTAPDRIRASLALVVDDVAGTGSAFCISASEHAAMYLTNAHVVGDHPTVTLYRQCPAYEKMAGTVIAKGDPNDVDLALVIVHASGVRPAEISNVPPRRDIPVTLMGYARVQIWAAKTFGELYPASHNGTVTAVNRSGNEILHDALSRPGNSGGPLFDPVTGVVYGVQRGGWEAEEESIAIGQTRIIAFAGAHNIGLGVRPELAEDAVASAQTQRK